MSQTDGLPGAGTAWVEERKILKYLLDLTHPQGAAKARFFLGRGFAVETWTVMRDALIAQGTTNVVVRTIENEFGKRYTVECICPTPDATNPCIRSVWEVKPEDPRPRLITAHPFD